MERRLLAGEQIRAANNRLGLTIRNDSLDEYLATAWQATLPARRSGKPGGCDGYLDGIWLRANKQRTLIAEATNLITGWPDPAKLVMSDRPGARSLGDPTYAGSSHKLDQLAVFGGAVGQILVA